MRKFIIPFCMLLALAMIVSCSDDKGPAAPGAPTGTNSYSVTSDWDCSVGVDCQDVYEFNFTAGANVTIAVSSITGNSVLRLALFAPGVALDGVNLLMGDTNDRRCGDQDEADTLVVAVPTTGTYHLAVGRDWGLSAGASGMYSLSVTSPTKFTVGVQNSNDTASQASGADCPFTTNYQVDGGWACSVGVSCQDVYDIEMETGTQVSISVTNVTGNSVLRLALFAPGVTLSGTNLLTSSASDRQCGGQNASDNVGMSAPSTGTYRLAIGRDWGSSAGASGTYRLNVTTDIPFSTPVQTVEDGASQAVASGCPTINYQVSSSWSCAAGVSCQDVYDISFPAGASVTINVTNVTGNSVPRLALFGPGDTLAGTNLLNSSNNDRRCVGQNANDSVAVIASAGGVYRLAIGRDWGLSAGGSGNYTLTVTANSSFLPVGQTSNNTASQAAGAQCP